MDSTSNTLTFAKVLVDSDGRNHCGVTSDIYHAELEKLAKANKRDGESVQQAYVRVSEQTEAGSLLLKAALRAPAPAPKQEVQDLPARPEPAGEASAELERLARFEAKAKGGSYEQNYVRLLTSPEHKQLVMRARAEELHATRMVADSRWPLENAERSSRTREWVGELDAVGRRRFRPDSK
jgi:hypothetical protein